MMFQKQIGKLITCLVLAVAILMVCGPVVDHAQAKQEKVSICHIPPGNPDNARVIKVGAAAVAAHLAHGDTEVLENCVVVDD